MTKKRSSATATQNHAHKLALHIDNGTTLMRADITVSIDVEGNDPLAAAKAVSELITTTLPLTARLFVAVALGTRTYMYKRTAAGMTQTAIVG